MARKRKTDAALYKAIQEEMQLAQLAAEAMPTAEELEIMQQQAQAAQAAQEAAEALQAQMPTAEQMQAAQEAQEAAARIYTLDDGTGGEVKELSDLTNKERISAIESLNNAVNTQAAALQQEIQEYLHRPLSEIQELPAEKRELVWNELVKQIAAEPGFHETMNTIIEAGKKAAEAAQMWAERLSWTKKALEQAAAKLFPAINATMQGVEKTVGEWLSSDNLQALQMFATLSPYITAEADAHPEKYGENTTEPADAKELIAAAARRARADGQDIPLLKVEEQGEQMEMQLVFPSAPADKEETRLKRIEEARQRREQAQAEGVFDTTSSNLATIAEKGLGFSYFTSAVIKNLPGGIEMENLMLDSEGKINLYDLTRGEKPIQEVLKEVDQIHTGFLMWALGLAYNNSDLRETNSNNAIIPVNVPAVLNRMGIDPRPRQRKLNAETNKKELIKREENFDMADLRRDKFMGFMRPFLNMAAFFGDDLYQIIGFYRYEKATETAYISIPYLFKLVEYSKLHATKHGAIVNIFHADIMTENQTAVEVANRIAMGVLLRGVQRPDAKTYKNVNAAKDKKTVQQTKTNEKGDTTTVIVEAQPRLITWAPKFATIINDCPQLSKELAEIRTATGAAETAVIEAAKTAGKEPDAEAIAAAHKADHKTDARDTNNKLRDVFNAAIRIIMEKSDMPEYYAAFKIRTGNFDTFKPPTKSTLNEKLIITHKGKNPHYHGQ